MVGALCPLAAGWENTGTHRHTHTYSHTHSPGQLEAGGQDSSSPLKAPGFSSARGWDHQDMATTPGSGTPLVEAARGQFLPQCSVPAPCRGNRPLAPHPWVLERSRKGRSCQQCRQGSHTGGPVGVEDQPHTQGHMSSAFPRARRDLAFQCWRRGLTMDPWPPHQASDAVAQQG